MLSRDTRMRPAGHRSDGATCGGWQRPIPSFGSGQRNHLVQVSRLSGVLHQVASSLDLRDLNMVEDQVRIGAGGVSSPDYPVA